MKIKCDFCKTEYSIDRVPSVPVKCALCGHTWTVATPSRKNSWLMFLASFCALLSAIVFTAVVVVTHQAKQDKQKPLIANVNTVETTTDENGVARLMVRGTIVNQSDDIYGVPDLMIVSFNANGDVIAQQKFMPTATLLDSGASVQFNHVLSVPVSGVKRVSAYLIDVQDMGGGNEKNN